MGREKHLYLHLLFIGAFLLASFSPACAFVSGKTQISADGYIEICTPLGVIKRIPLPPGMEGLLDIDADNAADTDPSPLQNAKTDCGFCFAQAHMAKDLISAPEPVLILSEKLTLHAVYLIARSENRVRIAQPRAPPVLA